MIMSIKLSLRTPWLKDMIGSYIREHSSEIAIVGIMTTVLAGVAVIADRGYHAGICPRWPIKKNLVMMILEVHNY